LKSTAADIHTEPMRWSLSWNPDGRSERFTREAILAAAPTTSGVYGLFNFDCQLIIGAAANIREALLRHESETDFQSTHLRPTGFTFEPCAEELRAAKAADLIAKFHPLLQAEATLTEGSVQSKSSSVNDSLVDRELVDTDHELSGFPVDDQEEHPRVRAPFDRKRVISAVLCGVVAVLIFSLGLFTNNNLQERASGATEDTPARASLSQFPASEQVGSGTPLMNVSSTAVSTRAAPGSSTSPSIPGSDKKWSVQISAVPTEAAADALMQRLKDSGYDSYVIKAEVKGQSYYRVRVGRFDSQADAESVRHSLTHKEGYRDAYLTDD
jgi:cell division septation protein DedD